MKGNSNILIPASKPYFKNLDALRFFAAAALMLHALTIKIEGAVDPEWMSGIRLFAKNGALCVNLLHVMSGFLITFLLLREEKSMGTFNILRYYLRRTLRIWPLYLVIVTASFFIIPPVMHWLRSDYHETANPYAYYFFWSNFWILKNGFPYSPILAVLWTVSVEEQFYLCWPWLMKLFRKNRQVLFSVVILACIGIRIYYRNEGITLFFNSFCIMSDFALGAWLAMLAVNEHPVFSRLKRMSRSIVVTAYLFLIVMIVFYHPVFDTTIATVLERLILGLAFAFVIFDQVFGENRIFNLHKIPGVVWLGKRAYGFFCFHQAGIIIAIKILTALHFIHTPFQYVVVMPVLAFVITVIFAAISYRFFEKYFLDWKKKYEGAGGS